MTGTADRQHMIRALALAAQGHGFTTPNPVVGAVVVKNGVVVGEGYHQKAGGPHAEIFALQQAGARAKGGTLYVTLEPCCHHGRTGPCTEAIIRANIARVVFAVTDPDPRVSGQGATVLRKAGIDVTRGIEQKAARQLNEIHFTYHEFHRPFVTVKTAQTLDGRIAAANGESKWITGEKARAEVHRLRASHDAVLVGMGTVRADNPSLTVRHVKGCTPYRVVLSGSLNFPRSCKLLQGNKDYRTIIASTAPQLAKFSRTKWGRQVITWEINGNKKDGRLDLRHLLEVAYAFGLRSLLIEGGSQIVSSFFREQRVDKYIGFIALKLLGSGVPVVAFERKKVHRLEDLVIPFRDSSITQVGEDIMFSGYPVWGND